jgi:hypothetical protein
LYATEFERTASFMTAGGIAAVHAQARTRDAIWAAMKRREVYGTSGHRILLWFDLLRESARGGRYPMGSEVTLAENPRFRVTAVGSFKQLPGCPAYIVESLQRRRLDKMGAGECYHPSDERYRIERIEIIRIRSQLDESEPVAGLIEDPWRVFDCEPSQAGCSVEFTDTEFVDQGRETIYYARVLEEPTPTINAQNLRASFDAQGNAVSMSPCRGDYRTDESDDCLANARQRAWSSPIFVAHDPSGRAQAISAR